MTSYDPYISTADVAGLIPIEYTDDLLQKVTEASAVLRLGRRLRDMPTSTRVMPVVSVLPTAYFVAEAGLKVSTEVNWANKTLVAEELAVICPIPQSTLDDSGYPIWEQVKPLIEEAAGLAIDQAVMYGTNIPAAWTTALGAHAGIVALSLAHSSTVSLAACADMYDALLGESGVLSKIEADGFIATGHIAHTSMKGKIRGCRSTEGQPIFLPGQNIGSAFATGELDGAPILYPLNGSVVAGSSLMISGQFNQLVYSMRQDINFKISTEGVISDNSGVVIYNLFQNDMVALRMTMRLAVAIPNPINRVQGTEGSRSPFAVLTA
jgi:HK97 family phage major capsid protein